MSKFVATIISIFCIIASTSLHATPKSPRLVSVFENGHWYRVDKQRHLRFESFLFDNGPDYYEQGLARFVVNRKVGFHNQRGEIIIKAAFDFASPFKNGRTLVCNGCSIARPQNDEHKIVSGGKWGVINRRGKILVPIEFASAEEAQKQLKSGRN